MTKQEQFLWIVQTCVLANAAHLYAEGEPDPQTLAGVSASGTFIIADEAVRASSLIPAAMSVSDAANEFITYMLTNLREIEEAAGERMTVPHWFARY